MKWKDIPGYEGLYQINTTGQCKSLARVQKLKDGRVRHKKEKILSPHLVGKYYMFPLRKDGKREDHLAHRLVLMAFDRLPKEGEESRHLNGIHLDNRIENLKWGTRIENARDKIRHDAQAKGEDFPHAKLNPSKVRQIRSSDLPTVDLSEKFNVSQTLVRKVINRKVWAHVK